MNERSTMEVSATEWQDLLPPSTIVQVSDLLDMHPVSVRVSRPRRTKVGDHRPPGTAHRHHRITVNGNLNPYAFLTTLLHEIAHMTTWERLRLRIRRYPPHGREWKQEFERILEPFATGGLLPADIAEALAGSMRNPAAATCSDRDLLLALARYDREDPGRLRLEQLADGSLFRVDSGQIFRLGRRLRSRYECFDVSSGREYRVHSLCRVESVSAEEVLGRRPRRPRLGKRRSTLAR